MSKTLLEVKDIDKSFGSNTVLQGISFDVQEGEVHALIGENGAGKSTLIKIIGGIYDADRGQILMNGEAIHCATPIQAMEKGISIVHQELSLAQNLTVAENIFMCREIKNKFGFLQWSEMNRRSAEIFEKIGIDIDPAETIGVLSVGMQQVVEIAKAISLDARVIFMDEPTSSLSEKEINRLFVLIRELTKQGVSIIYVSHKINEIMEICDRVSILRDGALVSTKAVKDTSTNEIISGMVGREITNLYPPRSSEIKDVVLECKNLSRYGYFHDVEFKVHAGEILGFYGLVGAGRSEVARTVVGADKATTGEIYLNGQQVQIKNPRDALYSGIGYLTEDRKQLGLFLEFSIEDNIVTGIPQQCMSSAGFVQQDKIHQIATEFVQSLEVRPADSTLKVGDLSGGNQQKVLLAKWIAPMPKVLIVDEPTRGVDVGAKSLIHKKLREMAEAGMAVIVITSEMPEVMGLSDRIAVFREGRMTGVLDNCQGQVTQNQIMGKAVQ